jgi:hypothetical protein
MNKKTEMIYRNPHKKLRINNKIIPVEATYSEKQPYLRVSKFGLIIMSIYIPGFYRRCFLFVLAPTCI